MTVPTYVFPLIGVPVAGFGLWKLLHRKPHVQTLTVGDDDGNTATVAVPATDDDPQASVSSVPPTSDDVSQVVTEDDVPPNVVAVPDGQGGYVHRHHRRRYIPPPITPGLIPYAPQVQTPYGVAPFAIRSPQDVQYGLNALGYGPLKVDGRIGPLSNSAIVEFQRRNNLPTVGYRPELHAHLQNAIARAVPRITSPGARPIIVGRTSQGLPVVSATTGPYAGKAYSSTHGDCAIGAEAVVATATHATPVAIAKTTGIKILDARPRTTRLEQGRRHAALEGRRDTWPQDRRRDQGVPDLRRPRRRRGPGPEDAHRARGCVCPGAHLHPVYVPRADARVVAERACTRGPQ